MEINRTKHYTQVKGSDENGEVLGSFDALGGKIEEILTEFAIKNDNITDSCEYKALIRKSTKNLLEVFYNLNGKTKGKI